MPMETSFQSLKAALTSQPVLHCPDERLQFVLQTDASARGIGTVLSQQLETSTLLHTTPRNFSHERLSTPV